MDAPILYKDHQDRKKHAPEIKTRKYMHKTKTTTRITLCTKCILSTLVPPLEQLCSVIDPCPFPPFSTSKRAIQCCFGIWEGNVQQRRANTPTPPKCGPALNEGQSNNLQKRTTSLQRTKGWVSSVSIFCGP